MEDKEREDWIIGEDDCYPVFNNNNRGKYHDEINPCSTGEKLKEEGHIMHYDRFAAELEGLEPCSKCFEKDPHVDT